jgi:hypothetical protein
VENNTSMANEFGWNGESNPNAIQKRRHLMKHCVSLSDVSSGNWIHGAGNTSSNARQGNMDQTTFWKQISNIQINISSSKPNGFARFKFQNAQH